MSYAVARTKLAKLLIKAGYNRSKSLKFVKYPYVESLQMRHNIFYWDARHESKMEYEFKDNFVIVPHKSGFSRPNDTNRDMMGDVAQVKASVRVRQETVDYWQSIGYDGAWFYSYPLKVNVKYRHTYPTSRIEDSYRIVGGETFGIAHKAGDYGEQLGTIPPPSGGWGKVD